MPAAKAAISKTPIGPFQTTVFGARAPFVRRDRRRPDIEAEAIANTRVADREHLVRSAGLDPIGDDVIDGQSRAWTSRFSLASILDRGAPQPPCLPRRATPDRQPARLEERVRHRATNQQAVDLAAAGSRSLRACRTPWRHQDRDERMLGRTERTAEEVDFRCEQQPGRGLFHVMDGASSVDAWARCADPNASST